MYRINGEVHADLNNIACKGCGRQSNYQIMEIKSVPFIGLFCDACGHKESIVRLEKYIPNPDAPWRQV